MMGISMKNINEMIEIIKAENPNGFMIGDEDNGYTQLTDEEYNQTILDWAHTRLQQLEQETLLSNKRLVALGKLEALGLTADDLKALGL